MRHIPENAISTSRRRLLVAASIGMPTLWFQAAAQTRTPLARTPAQTEGPFYPVADPADSDFDLLRNGSLSYGKGRPAWVEGVVTDIEGRPVRGAVVEIWQCDEAGNYHHPGNRGEADKSFQGFGRATVDVQGRYRFRTIRPSAYIGRTPHIHVKVKLERRELLTTQFYVADDPGNERDSIWRRMSVEQRAALTRPFLPVADGLRAEFPIVVET